MINDKLYQDLFLESHSKLAVKSLQTLSGFENILIIRNKQTNELSISKLEVTNWVFNRKLEKIYTYHSPMYIGEDNRFTLDVVIKRKYLKNMWGNKCHIIFNDKTYPYYLSSIDIASDFLDDEYTETKIFLKERIYY